jgi:glycosyltransferase involved in cell wall biosynthesis
LVEHFKSFLPADLWWKLDYAYPAFPVQAAYQKVESDTFTILLIASRFSDKGVPEALRAFEILRQRHGENVQLNLVCQTVPQNYKLPQGVRHYNVPWLTPELKTQLYRTADVLFLPCYSETAACFTEAYAFGVPVVTTRIHHGDEYVRDGQTGFLLDAPLFIYSDGFGRCWKTTWEFLDDVQARRERGAFEGVVEQAVDRLESMISGKVDLPAMRRAARAFHGERFSPEARNRKLHAIYQAALEKP